jgi:S-formylglutathione hydrolase FrmB
MAAVVLALCPVGAMAHERAGGSAAAVPSPGCVPRATSPARRPLRPISSRQLDARVTDLTLYSPAMQGAEHVNVMLPSGYRRNPKASYPVLYLLHGALGGYMDWYHHGAVQKIAGRLPMIVVMPDGGYDGSYSDWYGLLDGQAGPVPAWESFHIQELIPYIDSHFRVRAGAGFRFIAGLSAGGGGATHYAADNPGLFGAIGSFSGATDNLEQYPFYPTISEGLWLATDAPGDGPDGHCTWGDPYIQRVVWENNNPTYLAANLRGTPLWLASGNGQPGPLDPSLAASNLASVGAASATESEIWDMTKSFVRALDGAGVRHTDYFYGRGTHSWPYWRRDLRRFLVWLKPHVGHSPSTPGGFSFRTVDPSFSAWGWSFHVTGRDVKEFLYLSHVERSGLHALGTGTLTVSTARLYRPGASYRVSGRLVTANRTGRLHFRIDLGASHPVQQYRFGPQATAGWRNTAVTIRRVGA